LARRSATAFARARVADPLSAQVLPGNHDWFDGLSTFTRFIQNRDWLGGWLMPQERSYFVISLPQGWWIFGADLALADDIDLEQFKVRTKRGAAPVLSGSRHYLSLTSLRSQFFADVANRRVKEGDAVIIMTHEPFWVLDQSEKSEAEKKEQEASGSEHRWAEKNLRELMHTHLNGKVRARIAGDLHHYTRHVPVKKPSPTAAPRAAGGAAETYTAASDGGNLAVAAKRMAVAARQRGAAGGAAREENLPELIVSGGGGAFLHPTHTFAKSIDVNFGEQRNRPYVRTSAYPSEKVSFRLSFLNIWQFRWRNWRMDVLLGFLYVGIVYERSERASGRAKRAGGRAKRAGERASKASAKKKGAARAHRSLESGPDRPALPSPLPPLAPRSPSARLPSACSPSTDRPPLGRHPLVRL
jgi:hypothetical protein